MKLSAVAALFVVPCFGLHGAYLEDFRATALKLHNELRAKHGSPALMVDSKIEAVAAAWSERLAKMNDLKHSGNAAYGENLGYYRQSSGVIDAAALAAKTVRGWYSEIKDYDFDKPGFSSRTGHFTQVVWKASTRIGCGAAQAADGGVYVVCNYQPPGNMLPSANFSQNVSRPLK